MKNTTKTRFTYSPKISFLVVAYFRKKHATSGLTRHPLCVYEQWLIRKTREKIYHDLHARNVRNKKLKTLTHSKNFILRHHVIVWYFCRHNARKPESDTFSAQAALKDCELWGQSPLRARALSTVLNTRETRFSPRRRVLRVYRTIRLSAIFVVMQCRCELSLIDERTADDFRFQRERITAKTTTVTQRARRSRYCSRPVSGSRRPSNLNIAAWHHGWSSKF